MKVYLSGPQRGWRAELEGQHLLVSYAEPRQLSLLAAGWDVPGWLVDCGAFTTWRQGRPVDLDRYIAFCLDLERRAAAGEFVLDGYLALDCIPGEPHRMPTPEECDAAVETTRANLAAMRAAGLRPVPIYHEGEPIDVLDAYVAEGHELIALGATASRGKACLINWLLPIFERHPAQRFHGLAMTQARLMSSLPFASVDSTTWLTPCKYGLAGNKYLIRGRSLGFWQRLGYDFAPQCLDTAAADLAARGKGVLRQVGIGALLDSWKCPPGSPASRDGHLLIAPTAALGCIPKVMRRSRNQTPARAPEIRPRHPAPGQLPLFRRRRVA